MKSEKGAITLYVTVVCLFILIIGISAYVGVSNKQTAQLAVLDKIEQEYQASQQTEEDLYQQFLGGEIVPVYTAEQFAKVGTGEQIYVEQTGKIYTFGPDQTYMFYGVAEDLTETIKSELKTQLTEEVKIEIEQEGMKVTPVKAQEPEAPRLATNMVAVYWSTDGGTTASIHEEGATPIYSKIDANGNPSSTGTANPNFIEENWYEYVQGYNLIDTRTSRWANGVTDDGSYWVWIPRFKYKITHKPGVSETTSAGIIDVKFISTAEKSGVTINGSTYITYKNDDGEFITIDQNDYIIHPAFEDGSSDSAKAQGHSDFVEYNNGEWDSELAGFWVAKYEMSREDSSDSGITWSNTTTTGNVLTKNAGNSSYIRMVSKPGVSSWRSVSVGNIYTNCLAYDIATNSHLTKNSEWGAVAYLTHSQYGRNANEVTINNNSSYITGSAGKLGSTTGNIYGIYDIRGGAWEYTSGWNTASSSLGNGSSFAIKGEGSSRYATAYSNGTSTYNGSTVKTVCKIGDGTKETWITGSSGWFSDSSVFTFSSEAFITRGGDYTYGNGAGVFCSECGDGNGGNVAASYHGFRAVIVVN